jgi:hypothetical protein
MRPGLRRQRGLEGGHRFIRVAARIQHENRRIIQALRDVPHPTKPGRRRGDEMPGYSGRASEVKPVTKQSWDPMKMWGESMTSCTVSSNPLRSFIAATTLSAPLSMSSVTVTGQNDG